MIRRAVGPSLVFILVLAVLIQPAIPNTEYKLLPTEPLIDYYSSYMAHQAFNITSDIDFSNQGWPGNGSITNPYRIENLNITSNSTCVWIQNTTSCFVIQNCLFTPENAESGYASQYLASLTLTNVSNGIILENTFAECIAAISVLNATSLEISNNILQADQIGIWCRNVNSTLITNNTQMEHGMSEGISLYWSEDCLISSNKFGNVTFNGIEISICTRCNITGNEINGNTSQMGLTWFGIDIWYGIDCRISDNLISNFDLYGLALFSGLNNRIVSNTITQNFVGIHIESEHCVVEENILPANQVAVELINSNNSEVEKNTIQGKSKYLSSGISIHGGACCNITENTFTELGNGIDMQGSWRFRIEQNTVDESRYGIVFTWVGVIGFYCEVSDGPFADCDIIDNIFNDGGLYPSIENINSWNFSTINFENNLVHTKPIGFFHDLVGGSINGESYGQIVMVGCDGISLSEGDFSAISSDTAIYGNIDPGQATAITLIGCNACSVRNIAVHNNTIGISFQRSTLCELSRIVGYYNSWTAAILWQSRDMTITECDINDNLKGIGIESTIDSIVGNSTLSGNNEAVNLVNSSNCTLIDNQLHRNGDGIFLGDSDMCIIKGNYLNNNGRGILLNSSSYCLIIENFVANNTGVGIALDATSHSNEIYANIFAFNSPNAICEGHSNHWDNQADTGNSWSDYNGEGPYIIDEDDQDNFPSLYTVTITPSWEIDPLILIGAGSAVALVALLVYLYHRRRIVIID
jgi:parallel beta-helix repeat protein